ncbi:MAG TPA: glycine cleavage system aminomethyltransferase GcvT [Usitatibacteraceae bacterium]|nr:glycine cleavage system aminomethyltransferase GcvT [Usitatibacteraceae bacterium]
MSLLHTPLYEAHIASGAKMVDFGGWEMPLHYGSQIEEHHAVRKDAGMFDVSHMCALDVGGSRPKSFLKRLIANDVDKLTKPGKALYSAMLNNSGGVIDDLIVYWRGGDEYRVVINASTATKDLAHMKRIAEAYDVDITPRRDVAMIAVQGPNARAKVLKARPEWRAAGEGLGVFYAAEIGDVFLARTGYTGEDGFEITLPAGAAVKLWSDLKDAGVAECGLGARDTLRLEAGMNLYGNEMSETVNPLDAGMGWTVAMAEDSDREFIGRDALESQGQRWNFVGLKLLDKGVMRAHMKVITTHGDGETTSGTFSPTLGFSIALARVPLAVKVGDTVQVEIRDKRIDALVTKPSFVRHGKALV